MRTVTMRRLMTAMVGVVLGLGAAACSDDANGDVPAVGHGGGERHIRVIGNLRVADRSILRPNRGNLATPRSTRARRAVILEPAAAGRPPRRRASVSP